MHKYIRKNGVLEVEKPEDTKSYSISFGLSNGGVIPDKFTGTPTQLQAYLTDIEVEQVLIKQKVVSGKTHVTLVPYHAIVFVEIQEL